MIQDQNKGGCDDNTQDPLPSLEILLISSTYLMIRYPGLPDPAIATAIAEHLENLSKHPDCTAEILRIPGSRFSRTWRNLIAAGHAANIPGIEQASGHSVH